MDIVVRSRKGVEIIDLCCNSEDTQSKYDSVRECWYINLLSDSDSDNESDTPFPFSPCKDRFIVTPTNFRIFLKELTILSTSWGYRSLGNGDHSLFENAIHEYLCQQHMEDKILSNRECLCKIKKTLYSTTILTDPLMRPIEQLDSGDRCNLTLLKRLSPDFWMNNLKKNGVFGMCEKLLKLYVSQGVVEQKLWKLHYCNIDALQDNAIHALFKQLRYISTFILYLTGNHSTRPEHFEHKWFYRIDLTLTQRC